jgi:hypothetical protein
MIAVVMTEPPHRHSLPGGLTAVDVSDHAGNPGIHPDASAGVLDGQ